MMKKQKWMYHSFLAGAALLVIAFILQIWFPFLMSLRIVFGIVGLLFLPGYVWSWVIWTPQEANGFERTIYSVMLSLILVPLAVFLAYRIGIAFSGLLALGIVLFLILGGSAASLLKNMSIIKR